VHSAPFEVNEADAAEQLRRRTDETTTADPACVTEHQSCATNGRRRPRAANRGLASEQPLAVFFAAVFGRRGFFDAALPAV
jgi:hypothetical protein